MQLLNLRIKGLLEDLSKKFWNYWNHWVFFVASRISKEVGDLLAPVLVLENEATIKLIGFVVSLVGVWLVVYSAGVIVSKIFQCKWFRCYWWIFGFVLVQLNILIFSVIAYALYQVQSFKKLLMKNLLLLL